MEIQQYFDQKRQLYNLFLVFIENNDAIEENYQNLINYLDQNLLTDNREECEHFLRLLSSVFINHHRESGHFSKIERIIHYISNKIKQTLSNSEIYEIFQDNKIILLFLIKNKIIILDEIMIEKIISTKELNGTFFCHFFLPEIKDFISKDKKEKYEKDLLNINPNIFDNFDQLREMGENDSYICSLIRNDLIEDFIVYINQNNISLKSKIKPSIFESHPFLIENEPELIEYAAFFGSIQIFKYIQLNKVELPKNLWLYAIHSNNAELIHILEEERIANINEFEYYEKLFLESIKCHHNEIAEYLQNCYSSQSLDEEEQHKKFDENVIMCSFQYFNYKYYPDEFDGGVGFFNLYKYNYLNIVDLYLKEKEKYIESEIILIYIFFLNQISIN